ncbi:ATP-dependent nuclease [Alkalibacillus haloalkaliphilus]|uniref:ATPase AAA-type core domain-containing protein n=1 Tax=Alkalibacillus haloalkaliphilus TaxID=94136 RepID=A0A511WA86_9BACI|nr:AAA family ATPase [Alkalibacillus haloalkaliphilus]GEN46252.1 hypothetical protein AHA02nite_20280 [Alkalibacillus haloalkaliphilus]
MDIQFSVIEDTEIPYKTDSGTIVFLMKDSWNDWWEYRTVFGVYLANENTVNWIGTVKIGQTDLMHNGGEAVSPVISDSFNQLERKFFSLGQDVSYYYNLNSLGDEIRFQILRRLNDIALDEEIYEEVKELHITKKSILRSVSKTSVKGQYRRLANGNAELTEYNFSYVLPNNEMDSKFKIKVKPGTLPPSNIHVVIGRNGVGKTNLLKNLINRLRTNSSEYGELTYDVTSQSPEDLFANLVSVSFSSFDPGHDVFEEVTDADGIRYLNIGSLKKTGESFTPKSLEDLQNEFKESIKSLSNSAKTKRWKRAIKTLESDPIFEGLGIEYLIQPEFEPRIDPIFNNLSSGHKIVLLTITKLVETVEERSFVILDEPEIHLHPPLLSAFTRALSDLLIYRNAVALIATHSPVILQEVPGGCVWIMNRTNNLVSFDRPELETFGENIGTLTREIFGLEVTDSGFHTFLKNAIERHNSYEEIIEEFNDNLGMEARTILRSLLIARDDR